MKKLLLLLLFFPSFSFPDSFSALPTSKDFPIFLSQKSLIHIQNTDQPEFKNPAFKDQNWKQVQLPNNWKKSPFPNYNGIVWYRIHVRFPTEIPRRSLGVNLGYLSNLDQTWFNGVLIGQSGNFKNPSDYAYDIERIYEIPTALIRPGQDNVLAIRIKPHFSSKAGILQGKLKIDFLSSLTRSFYNQRIPRMILLTIYFLIGFYLFIVFLRHRRHLEFLAFAAFLAIFSFYGFCGLHFSTTISASFLLFKKLEYILLFLSFALFVEFIFLLFKQKQKNPLLIGYGITIIFGILYIALTPEPKDWNFINTNFIEYTWLIPTGLTFYTLLKQWKNKNSETKILLVSLCVFFLSIFFDILSLRDLFSFDYISKIGLSANYGFFTVILSLLYIFQQRSHLQKKQSESNFQNLKKQAETLRHSLNEKTESEYFTTLLLSQLSETPIGGSNITIDSYINQEKTLNFQKTTFQIGKHLCFTSPLSLQQKSHILFVSASSNKNSFQATQTTLIFTTILKTLIHQTNTIGRLQDKSPTDWLTETYHQLQAIFHSFQEDVSVSTLIGLIHEITGEVCFFNANHLQPILFRQAQTSFVNPRSPILPAIGSNPKNTVKIQKTLLKDQDILVLGTANRPDSETKLQFLNAVEAGEGNVLGIAIAIEQIKACDFSLLTLEFRKILQQKEKIIEDFLNIDKEIKDQAETKTRFSLLTKKRKEAIESYNGGRYQKCINILIPIAENFKRSSEKYLVYKTLGMAYFQLKQYAKALRYWQNALSEKEDDKELKKYVNTLKQRNVE